MQYYIQKIVKNDKNSLFISDTDSLDKISDKLNKSSYKLLIVLNKKKEYIGTLSLNEIDILRLDPKYRYTDKKDIKVKEIYNKDAKTISLSELQEMKKNKKSPFYNSSEDYIIVLDNHKVHSVIYDDLYSDSILKKSRKYLTERLTNRKLIIWGNNSEAKKFAKRLENEGFKIEYFIDSENCNSNAVRSYSDILFEKTEEIFILIVVNSDEYLNVKQKLIALGLEEDINFTYYRDIPPINEKINFDVTLSYNRVRDKLEGFEIFGDTDNEQALKIVVLGASTSESYFKCIKSWPLYLQDILKENKISSVLYCGGVIGYSSNQELLKLIRDVIPLKPDIVIVFDGYGDIYRWPGAITNCIQREKKPFITEYQTEFINSLLDLAKSDCTIHYGLPNNKSLSEFWFDNIRMMNAICKEFGIKFFSFIQPCYFLGNYQLTEKQKIVFQRWFNQEEPRPFWYSEDKIEFFKNNMKEIINISKQTDYINDFSNIFLNHTDVYIDYAHVNEKGNKIIASNVYDIICTRIELSERR